MPFGPIPGGGSGTVTSVAVDSTSLNITGSPITASGTIDVNLSSIDDGTVFGNTSGTPEAPSQQTLTHLLDYNFGNDQGSLLHRGATYWQIFAPGTDGQVLTTHGAGADATWSAAGNVVGPDTADDSAVVLFDMTSGKLLKNSLVTIDNFGNMTVNGGVVAAGIGGPPGEDVGIITSSGAMSGNITLQTGPSTTGNNNSGSIYVVTGTPAGSGIAGVFDVSCKSIFHNTVNISVGAGISLPRGNGTTGMTGTATLSGAGSVTVISSDCDANTIPTAGGITSSGPIRTVNNNNGTFTITSTAGAGDSGTTVWWQLINPNT